MLKALQPSHINLQLKSKIALFGSHRFMQDKLSLSILIPALALNLITLLVLVLKVRPSEFSVPVRYSSIEGFTELGSWFQIYEIPIFGLFVTSVNAYLAIKGFNRSRINSFFLLFGALVAAIFCLVMGLAFTAIS